MRPLQVQCPRQGSGLACWAAAGKLRRRAGSRSGDSPPWQAPASAPRADSRQNPPHSRGSMEQGPIDRDECVYMAKLAEQAERYDEMVEEMKKVAQWVHDQELSVEERNLLSVAYKNVIGARRASWRIISSIEQKEESKGQEEHVKRIQKYREVVRPVQLQPSPQAPCKAPPCLRHPHSPAWGSMGP